MRCFGEFNSMGYKVYFNSNYYKKVIFKCYFIYLFIIISAVQSIKHVFNIIYSMCVSSIFV